MAVGTSPPYPLNYQPQSFNPSCVVFLFVNYTTDYPIWGIAGSGFFTSSSAYKLISSKIHHNTVKKDFNWIWTMKIPNKIKHFLWLLNHNRLPCRSTLSRMDIPIEPTCKSCLLEDTTHIFWWCQQTSSI